MTLIIILMYICGCGYYFDKKIKWLKSNIILFQSGVFRCALFFVFLFLASLVVLVHIVPDGTVRSAMLNLCDYWLGLFFYMLLFLLLTDLITMLIRLFFGKRIEKAVKSGRIYQFAGLFVLAISLFFCIYGFHNSKKIEVNHYEVTINKNVPNMDELNIVLVSDLHLGYQTGNAKIQSMVTKINALHPDVVIIAGDIFNNDYDQIGEPEQIIEVLHQLQTTYGVYAVYGNHDVDETLLGGFPIYNRSEAMRDPRMITFLDKAGVTALSDQTTTIADGSIYLVGRLDLQRPGDGTDYRKSAFTLLEKLDHSKPVIVIDHEPVELKDTERNGADLLLSGHTHDGQFFPLVCFQKLKWKNPKGCIQYGNMYSCVTAGIGTFAPGMRVMTTAEIMQITVHFDRK